MPPKLPKILCLFPLALLLLACDRPQSANISSADLRVEYQVTEQPGSAFCTAEFAQGDKGQIGYTVLSGQDYVECNGQRMGRSDSIIPLTVYSAQVPRNNNAKYTITLHRTNETLASDVEISDGIVLTSPAANSSINRHQALEIDWQASIYDDAKTQLALMDSSSFKFVTGQDGPKETGKHIFSQSELESFSPQANAVILNLTRSRPGNVAKPLQGSFLSMAYLTVEYNLSP